jgi:hypothetical protein
MSADPSQSPNVYAYDASADGALPPNTNDIRKQFLSARNMRRVIKCVFTQHAADAGIVPYETMFKELPHHMYHWVRAQPEPSLVFENPIEGIIHLNNLFTAIALKHYRKPTRYDGNPYRARVLVGSVDEHGRSTLAYTSNEDLMAADWHTLDVHRDITVMADASRYRNCNRIRAQEISRHVRRYDREANDSRESYVSLENPVRAADMRRFVAPVYTTGGARWYGCK